MCRLLSGAILVFECLLAPLALMNWRVQIAYPILAACMHVAIAKLMGIKFWAHSWCYMLSVEPSRWSTVHRSLVHLDPVVGSDALLLLALTLLASLLLSCMVLSLEVWPLSCFPLFCHSQDSYAQSESELLARLQASRTNRMMWRMDWAEVELSGPVISSFQGGGGGPVSLKIPHLV